jgi:hypothetical protein
MDRFRGRGAFRGALVRLVLGATAAAMAPVGRAAPSFGPDASRSVSAGRLLAVALEQAAPGVEERELVLSLDGGRTFAVRLTGEIRPGDLRAVWRVPGLPTDHAVLGLRQGTEGSEEEIAARSAEFTILPGPGLAPETLRFREGEWKTREADPGRDSLPDPSLRGAAPARCGPLSTRSHAFEEPARALQAAGEIRAPDRDEAAAPAAPGGPPQVSPPSLFLPLRE